MKIYAPVKNYSGVSAGVRFVNGVGETDDERLIDWFSEKGYQVETGDPPDDLNDGENGPDNTVPLENMTVEELKAFAAARGIDTGNAATQSGVLKKIKEASADGQTASPENPAGN